MALDHSPLQAVVVQAICYEASPDTEDAANSRLAARTESTLLHRGLIADYFRIGSSIADFPATSGLTPRLRRVDDAISFRTIDAFATTGLSEFFCAQWRGRIRVNAAGRYTFFLASDDGSRLYVNRELLIDNGGQHVGRELSGGTELVPGDHEIAVDYFNGWWGGSCILSWDGPGFSKRVVPREALFHSHDPSVDAIPLAERKLSGAPLSTNTVISNADGEFALVGLKSGWYQLRAQVPGGSVIWGDFGRMFLVKPRALLQRLNFNLAPFRKGTWQVYGVLDGLAGPWVHCMLEDSDGALWFGTSSGASRFDGKSFVNYSSVEGLPGNRVLAINRDPDGVIWFGTERGLTRFDHRQASKVIQ